MFITTITLSLVDQVEHRRESIFRYKQKVLLLLSPPPSTSDKQPRPASNVKYYKFPLRQVEDEASQYPMKQYILSNYIYTYQESRKSSLRLIGIPGKGP